MFEYFKSILSEVMEIEFLARDILKTKETTFITSNTTFKIVSGNYNKNKGITGKIIAIINYPDNINKSQFINHFKKRFNYDIADDNYFNKYNNITNNVKTIYKYTDFITKCLICEPSLINIFNDLGFSLIGFNIYSPMNTSTKDFNNNLILLEKTINKI